MGNFLKKFNVDIFFYILLFVFIVLSIVLAIFRDTVADEAIYIHETFLMSELLKNGIWFGDYAVGLHGFLFKIPPAIVFMFTEPSVFLLTLYNILLACLALYFFYKFLKEAFGWRYKAILALGLLMANFHFMISTPTYLREMPSLFVVSSLFYGIFKNWKPWVLGLVFLLLLDAKEYLFLMFGLGYFIWIVTKYFKARNLKNIFFESIQVYGFSLLYVILMFTTSIIPVNMFIASIFGLITVGIEHVAGQFTADSATVNLLKDEEVRTIFQFVITEDMHIAVQMVLGFLNTILSYIGKLLYPRTFSFIGIPKIIIFPAIYIAFKILKSKVENFKKILPILLLTFLAIYILRASHGRYLLPIMPLVAIYFIQFIHYPFKDKKEVIRILIATFLFMSFSFYFETSYLIHKIFIEVSLFTCIAISILEPFAFSKYFYNLFQKATILFCIIAMFGTSILFSMTQGQISNYILFGVNREVEKIVEIVPQNENVWINNTKSFELMKAKMGYTYSWPEWKWKLAEFIPKKDLLKAYGEQHLFNDFYGEPEIFINYIDENEIEYLVYVESTIDEELFEFEYLNFSEDIKMLDFIKQEEAFVKQETYELQNKKVYLFKVDFE
jgi:hypothetical protein